MALVEMFTSLSLGDLCSYGYNINHVVNGYVLSFFLLNVYLWLEIGSRQRSPVLKKEAQAPVWLLRGLSTISYYYLKLLK